MIRIPENRGLALDNQYVYVDSAGDTYRFDADPVSIIDLEDARKTLGVPGYMDLADPTLTCVCAAIWGCQNSSEMPANTRWFGRPRQNPTPLLFGGAAVKMLSPSSNQRSSPLNRRIGDIDFVVPKAGGERLLTVLKNLHVTAGPRYHFFTTRRDNFFNALRAGSRYRLHYLDHLEGNAPVVKTVDVVAGNLSFRHSLGVSEADFKAAAQNLYTLGPEKVVALKLQVISDVDASKTHMIAESRQGFRVLEYTSYPRGRLILGMEQKDALDVFCVLLDCFNRDTSPRFSVDSFVKIFERDDRFRLTAALNLGMMLKMRGSFIEGGVDPADVEAVSKSVRILLDALEPVDKTWDKPWWNRDVEPPAP